MNLALGHRLETLQDGLTTFCNGVAVPMPLTQTRLDIQIVAGLAMVKRSSLFRNTEATPIEAVMTFPVGFDAVVTGLSATINGRRLIGTAKEKAEARAVYEAALDAGKLSVLHEEALRGIHVLSVGALPAGAEVEVVLEQTLALTDAAGTPFFRLPMTAGHIYGTSPLLPSDDLVTAAGVKHLARLRVSLDQGQAILPDGSILALNENLEIVLDRAVELRCHGASFGKLVGQSADGRLVELDLAKQAGSDAALDLHVIVDRSGSTGDLVREGDISISEAMREGLIQEFATLGSRDKINLWQFDDQCQHLGAASGVGAVALAQQLEGPSGGTELAGAINAALQKGAKDILVLTDGQTWAHMVEDLKGKALRISAILVGPSSLDANIGHLCALTGGQVLYCPGRDVASSLQSAFAGLRVSGEPIIGQANKTGPQSLTCRRGGVTIRAKWMQEPASTQNPDLAQSVGRYAAALALPLLGDVAAEAWARSHSLCTHISSLVLVDDAGEVSQGFSQMRKVPMMEAMMEDVSLSRPRAIGEPLMRPTYADRSFSASMRAPESLNRVYRRATQVSTPAPQKPSQGIGSIAKIIARLLPAAPDQDRFQTFAGFAWDRFGDDLLAHALRTLTPSQIEVLQGLEDQLVAAAKSQGNVVLENGIVTIFALGLIAQSQGGRLANRFARRALKDAPDWVKLPV
jgi:hypothetical protein